jgi:hypothetical protein
VAVLLDAEVEVVVLGSWSVGVGLVEVRKTYSNTSNIGAECIQNRDHVATWGVVRSVCTRQFLQDVRLHVRAGHQARTEDANQARTEDTNPTKTDNMYILTPPIASTPPHLHPNSTYLS